MCSSVLALSLFFSVDQGIARERLELISVSQLEKGSTVWIMAFKAEEKYIAITLTPDAAMGVLLTKSRQRAPRPIVHDMFSELLREANVQLVEVSIDGVEAQVYAASVLLKAGDKKIKLDSRPSDAVMLALMHGAPMWVTRHVLDRVGIVLDDELKKHEESLEETL